MELWQRYRTYIASVGMWDTDSGRTHAVEAGRTLCGCTPDRNAGPEGGAWERHSGQASIANVDCRRCAAAMRRAG
jgi:hypothetical protein